MTRLWLRQSTFTGRPTMHRFCHGTTWPGLRFSVNAVARFCAIFPSVARFPVCLVLETRQDRPPRTNASFFIDYVSPRNARWMTPTLVVVDCGCWPRKS